MEKVKHIPADIFEEMAGLKDISSNTPNKEDNIISEPIISPINYKRLEIASKAFNSKIDKKIHNSFYKVIKKVFNYQEQNLNLLNSPNKKIILKEGNSEDKKIKKTTNILKKIFKKLSKAIKKAAKLFFKVFAKLLKWLGKLALKATKIILNIFGKLLTKAVKKLSSIISKLTQTIIKITKFIFKNVAKLIKSIWRIFRNLFFRGKGSKKMFKGEPGPQSMNLPKQKPIKGSKIQMKITVKAVTNKSLFIMKFLKKMFSSAFKFLDKFIIKILGKTVKKIVGTISKIITKFIVGQAVGSVLPLLGNSIALAISIGFTIHELYNTVDFVLGLNNEIELLGKDIIKDKTFDENNDIEDDDIEDNTSIFEENYINYNEILKILKEKEKKKEKDEDAFNDYIVLKKQYLDNILEVYKDNKNYIKIIQERIQSEDIENLDIFKLQREIIIQQSIEASNEEDRYDKEIINDNKIKSLISQDKDLTFVNIWSNLITYIKIKLLNYFNKSLNYTSELPSYKIFLDKLSFSIKDKKKENNLNNYSFKNNFIFNNLDFNYYKPSSSTNFYKLILDTNWDFNLENNFIDKSVNYSNNYQKYIPDITIPVMNIDNYKLFVNSFWRPENEYERKERVKQAEYKILDTENKENLDTEFTPQMPFYKVIDKINTYKVDVLSETKIYRDEKTNENYLNKIKFFRWVDILNQLIERKRIS